MNTSSFPFSLLLFLPTLFRTKHLTYLPFPPPRTHHARRFSSAQRDRSAYLAETATAAGTLAGRWTATYSTRGGGNMLAQILHYSHGGLPGEGQLIPQYPRPGVVHHTREKVACWPTDSTTTRTMLPSYPSWMPSMEEGTSSSRSWEERTGPPPMPMPPKGRPATSSARPLTVTAQTSRTAFRPARSMNSTSSSAARSASVSRASSSRRHQGQAVVGIFGAARGCFLLLSH